MDLREIARLRLHNQHLLGPPLAGPEAVVGWFGAMQAQEYALATWSVGQRSSSVDVTGFERAFAAGAILRTHALRPTWHFVRPQDVRWVLKLTGPRVHQQNALMYRRLELDPSLLARSREVIEGALTGGRHRTRTELAAALKEQGISPAGLRLVYILMSAELQGLICSGERRGKQHTYALLDERVPGAPSLPRDEALATLTTRYFASHGPATVRDYAWWSGLTVADARRGLEIVGTGLAGFVSDGRHFWLAPDAVARAADAPPGDAAPAHLVQGFDEYLVAYRDSRDVFTEPGTAGPDPGARPPLLHALLMDGRIVGRWQRRPRASPPAIELRLLRRLERREGEALERELGRYARFIGQPLRLMGASD
jgi:DNA glycosylase AlkZ-like